ncbi:MAG: methionyl-tRNA formyltransferase [Desulfobacterales bacterium]
MKHTYSIIFMGTPYFAVPTLQALVQNGHDVELVVTQPDRPKGRGRQLTASPVKVHSLKLNLDILQPSTLKNEEFIEQVRHIQPDFFVVIAFGHILTEKILQVPKLGAINIHASLLPKYRGPAPIQWAIINGERQTGVTTMLMDSGLKPIPQDHSQATYAPLLKKQDGHIDWQKPAKELQSFIRGMTPWPGAFTYHHQNRLKVLRTALVRGNVLQGAGTILPGFADELRVATGKDALSIIEIQGPSGKRLAIADFLRGYPLPPGTILK